jgi:hypothetical protein
MEVTIMENFTAKEVIDINLINQVTRSAGLGTVLSEIITNLNAVTVEGTPVNAVNATKSVLVTGVVLDGETVTINNPAVTGADVYEFCADVAQTKTVATNIAVNIHTNTTKALVTLTLDTQPTAGDTMTIGVKKYTFVTLAADDQDGEISVGADLAAAKVNVVAAINGTDGHNTPHPLVSAATFVADACAITALVGGTAGNSIAATETYTAGTNVFSSATLATGANCSAANAITALVAAITASDTQGVGAADGAGDTIDLTADTAGVVGNAITLAETLTNGSFTGGATVLAGGVNGTIGTVASTMIDASYIYRCVAANTISGKNWRRISLGSAY